MSQSVNFLLPFMILLRLKEKLIKGGSAIKKNNTEYFLVNWMDGPIKKSDNKNRLKS